MLDPLIGISIDFAPQPVHDEEAPRGGLGSQVLPVAHLDDDFKGEAIDGMQYLALVRREFEALPRVSRVVNPYQRLVEVESVVGEEEGEGDTRNRPNEAWKEAFMKQFAGLRARMAASPPLSSFPPATHNEIPSAKDSDGWSTFIYGKRIPTPSTSKSIPDPIATTVEVVELSQSLDSIIIDEEMTLEEAKALALASLELDAPELPPLPPLPPTVQGKAVPTYHPDFPPHIPSPAILLALDHQTIVRLLEHMTEWLEERQEAYETAQANEWTPSTTSALLPPSLRRKKLVPSTTAPHPAKKERVRPPPPLPTTHEISWILSLLTRLSVPLAGEDTSTLRTLARLLLSMNAASESSLVGRDPSGRTKEEREGEEREAEGRAGGWMVVLAVATGWGQWDLWNGTG